MEILTPLRKRVVQLFASSATRATCHRLHSRAHDDNLQIAAASDASTIYGLLIDFAMDSELTRPSELDESQSSKLSSVNPSDMENAGGGSDSDSDSSSSNDGESEAAPQVEWLATGRQRRSTAGNRMKSMLANEEPDSDLELLFAEDENDQGFSDAGEHASDVQMDSSSDEDDNNDNDELEGEKELDRQAKERRATQRKRKAQEAIPAKFRKKVRIDTSNSTPRSSVAPSTPQPNQPRPKKKSERSSWLPSVADMPTRASSRSTTRLSKEQLHAQMEEREAKRLKQLAQMQKKAARLEALKKPPMTQEERLHEAAVVEERNSKSLNRWEEAEKQREEERRAKLAALQERTLSGPVISFWSGMGRFGDGWRKGEGIHVAVEEKPKRAKKEKPAKEKGKKKDGAADIVKAEAAGDAKPTDAPGADSTKLEGQVANGSAQNGEVKANANEATSNQQSAPDAASKDTTMEDVSGAPTQEPTAAPAPATPAEKGTADAKMTQDPAQPALADINMTDAPPPATDGTKKMATTEVGGQNAATKPDPVGPNAPETGAPKESDSKAPESSAKSTIETAHDSNGSATKVPVNAKSIDGAAPVKPDSGESQTQPAASTQANASLSTASQKTTDATPAATTNGESPKNTPLQPIENESLPASKVVSQIQSEAATPQPCSPLDGLPTTRDAIIFQNFDENAIKSKDTQTQVIFGRKMGRLPKPAAPPICLITNNPARYRDPKTDLHFYSAAAFKELQRLQSGEYRWSKLLGAWAGSGTCAARGVPDRFLNPARCPTLEEVQRIERKKEEKEKLRLQKADDEAKAKETKSTAPNAIAAGGGSAASANDGAAASEQSNTRSVKTEDTTGTVKTEAPAVAA
ncbi:hypothetical protein PWT90_10908 [Aphanocladium album]|nr:hypothetical protein PWT90_10908 [Aphanocladium album]